MYVAIRPGVLAASPLRAPGARPTPAAPDVGAPTAVLSAREACSLRRMSAAKANRCAAAAKSSNADDSVERVGRQNTLDPAIEFRFARARNAKLGCAIQLTEPER